MLHRCIFVRMSWTQTLLHWYDENKRDFPWRGDQDPYRVWLSEVIMQQTRVEQGTPYFERFIADFPTLESLAQAHEEEVLKLWQGLGYYSRARNLLAAARWMVEENKGEFPNHFKGLLQLKGVGDYTASAISSICFNEAQAVVDGNVYRFLSRYFGIATPIDHSSAFREFKALAQQLMGSSSPGEFNQALMEFGALQCTPKQPQCQHCPFQADCVAFSQGKVAMFPIKKKKLKQRKRFFNYLIFVTPSGNTFLQQRVHKDIWEKLFEFPLIETEHLLDGEELQQHPTFQPWQSKMLGVPRLLNDSPIKHLLSHQQLMIQFWQISLAEEDTKSLPMTSVDKYPMPIVLADFVRNVVME